MNAQSQKSNPRMSGDSNSATSSAGFSAGPSPSSSPAGLQADLFGPQAAPAPHSPLPASAVSVLNAKARTLCGALDELATQYAQLADTHGLPTPATYGQKFGDSQHDLDLDTSSESRLTRLLPSTGSLLYRHRSGFSATVLGRRVYRLRASARPTSDSDFGGWPTVIAADSRPAKSALARKKKMKKPRSERGGGCSPELNEVAQLAGWLTPTAQDGSRGSLPPRPHDTGTPLSQQLAGWVTPTARDGKDGSSKMPPREKGHMLGQQVLGKAPPSPSASTESGEQPLTLNPEFCRWLQGFPDVWGNYAPTGTP